jgi:hypothetical protein
MRIGSQIKDIPMPIEEDKEMIGALNAILEESKINKKINLNKLSKCIISSYWNEGVVIKKKNIENQKAVENKILLNVLIKRKNVSKKT